MCSGMPPKNRDFHEISKFPEMSWIFGKSSAAAIFFIFFGPAGGSRTLAGAFAPRAGEKEREREKDKMEKAADRAIRNIVIEQKQRLNVNEAVLLVLQNMT